jgi:hypothetical protein
MVHGEKGLLYRVARRGHEEKTEKKNRKRREREGHRVGKQKGMKCESKARRGDVS